MNYLAHAYLSFNDPEILVGNLISDFVKGKKKYDFPNGIQRGIQLHRFIDDFTDSHASTRIIKDVFKPVYGLYGNAFADITYDHFLATDRREFATDAELLQFSEHTYQLLDNYVYLFPERFKKMYPYMKQHNWLYNYRLKSGIHRSFEGLVHRAKFMNDAAPAATIFEEHYNTIQQAYDQFFPFIKLYAKKQIELLNLPS